MSDGNPDPIMKFLIELNKGVNFLCFVKDEEPNSMPSSSDTCTENSTLNYGNSPSGGEIRQLCSPQMLVNSKCSHAKPEKYRIMSFVMVGVHRDYRRFGLARKLVEKSMSVAKALGCALIKAEAVALSSQRLYEQIGYVDVKVIQHADWKNEDGEEIFKCTDGTTCGKLMVLNIQD